MVKAVCVLAGEVKGVVYFEQQVRYCYINKEFEVLRLFPQIQLLNYSILLDKMCESEKEMDSWSNDLHNISL